MDKLKAGLFVAAWLIHSIMWVVVAILLLKESYYDD